MKILSSVLLLSALPLAATAAKVEMPEWDDSARAASYRLGGGLWPSGILGGEEGAAEEEGATAPENAGETVADADTATSETAKPGTAATGTAADAKPAEGGELVSAEQAIKFYGPAGTEPIEENPVASETAVANADPAIDSPPGDGLVSDDMLKFPDAGEEKPAIEALPPLEGELEDLYFAHAPVEFLIDPQRLLTEQKSNDIKRFLEFHSDESDFHIYVMVFGETQKIPDDVDIAKLHREWFSDRNTVMMLYYREHPEMTEFVYNDVVKSSLPGSVFDRIRQNCLREGGATDLAPDQVEKMAIELSIQLYWLGRLMKHETKEAQEKAAETPVHELPASSDAPELLREYAPGIFVEDGGRRVVSMILTVLMILGTIAAVAAVGWFVVWLRSRDRVAGKPLLFPSFQVVPRLGGEFCGGGFVSMSFEIGEGSDFT